MSAADDKARPGRPTSPGSSAGAGRSASRGSSAGPAGEELSGAGLDRPGRLRVLVAGLIFAEALALAGAAVLLLVLAVTSRGGSPAALLSLAVIAVIVGAGLAWCARGVLSGLYWTRGPVLTWQLLQAAVGAPLTTTGAWWAGVPLLAAAVLVGVLIAGRLVVTQDSDRF